MKSYPICIKAEIMKHVDRLRDSELDHKCVALRHLTTQFKLTINDMTERQCVEALFKYIEHFAEELVTANDRTAHLLMRSPTSIIIESPPT